MPLKVWTAQYRYPGQDRLDITVKGKDQFGKNFAPTWDMVNRWKRKELSNEGYTVMYVDMMRNLFRTSYNNVWLPLLQREEVTLVCFCPAGSFCHRYILADILTKLGAVYMGERQ